MKFKKKTILHVRRRKKSSRRVSLKEYNFIYLFTLHVSLLPSTLSPQGKKAQLQSFLRSSVIFCECNEGNNGKCHIYIFTLTNKKTVCRKSPHLSRFTLTKLMVNETIYFKINFRNPLFVFIISINRNSPTM